MAQHDNGRRPAGMQSGAWQQGHREQQDASNAQQDQSSGGRYGNQFGGQQGGHYDQGGSSGHQNQYDQDRQQQGDNWRERQGPSAGGWRPAMEERDRSWNDRGGQGSLGGQASDNDYGNRGITESGNFGNYSGGRDDSYGTLSGQQRHGQGGQRFGSYRHGYDARSDSTGGLGNGNFGPDRDNGGDWNTQRAWRDEQRYRGWQGNPGNQDRYGDNGYQGNFQQGQRGQAYHDPDYRQWRSEQLNRLDRDYDDWRQHRYQRFADEFDQWRSNRGNDASRAGLQASATQADASRGDTSKASADKGKSSDISSTSSSSSSKK